MGRDVFFLNKFKPQKKSCLANFFSQLSARKKKKLDSLSSVTFSFLHFFKNTHPPSMETTTMSEPLPLISRKSMKRLRRKEARMQKRDETLASMEVDIDERDLATTILVLERLTREKLTDDPTLALLRGALERVVPFFSHGRRSESEMDRDARNASQMRARRLENLQLLLEPTGGDDEQGGDQKRRRLQLLVPDGVVLTDGTQDVCAQLNGVATAAAADDDSSRPPLPLPPRMLSTPAHCYVCKLAFRELHFFYDALCPECAAFNYAKRSQTADLTGKIALLTGARVKIGYRILLKLLRAGARVVATTRFPVDLTKRLRLEADHAEWESRVHIYGIDLRQVNAVQEFIAAMYREYTHLDILINNACQTNRRPPAFYKQLVDAETNGGVAKNDPMLRRLANLGTDATTTTAAQATQLALMPGDTMTEAEQSQLFPDGAVDVHAQQVDLRSTNSWMMKLDQVPVVELGEVLLINFVAPFELMSKLKPLMERNHIEDRVKEPRWIINVSAMEGQFYRNKTVFHPHTNSAKAALNMTTRTSANDYRKSGIYMSSADTGWINPMWAAPAAAYAAEAHNFQAPLDEIDAAARVLDPVFDSILNKSVPPFGVFLKDYKPCAW